MRNITPKEDSYQYGPSIDRMERKSKKIYPKLTLAHEFFPEAKKWEVGKEYKVKMKLKMTGLSISKYQNDSEFEIIGFESGGKKKEGEEEEMEE